MRMACFFVLMSLSSSVLAKKNIERLVEEYDLEPLADSDYWKRNPGILPYDECKLMSADGDRIQGHTGTLGIGLHSHRQKFSMFCFSKSLKLGFQIPIEIDKDFLIGPALNVNLINYTSGHVRRLHNKSLIDLYGSYKGFSGGIGVGTSLSGAILFNNKIALTLNESASLTAVELTAAFRKVHVGNRKLQPHEVYSGYYSEKRAELLEEEQKLLVESYASGYTSEYVSRYEQERRAIQDERFALESWPDSRKYSSTWKFWVHHLREDQTDLSQCQIRQQHRGQRTERTCYLKLFGELDYEFMSSLQFEEVK